MTTENLGLALTKLEQVEAVLSAMLSDYDNTNPHCRTLAGVSLELLDTAIDEVKGEISKAKAKAAA